MSFVRQPSGLKCPPLHPFWTTSRVFLTLLIAILLIPDDSRSQVYDCTSDIVVKSENNPNSGIDCQSQTSDFDVEFENNALIKTTDAAGIYFTGTGSIVIDQAKGKIETSDKNSAGIYLDWGTTAGSKSHIINLEIGNIETNGTSSHGIAINGYPEDFTNSVEIKVHGSVEINGPDSHGILVEARSAIITLDIENGGSVSVNPEHTYQTIDSDDDDPMAIYAIVLAGDDQGVNKSATIINKGTVSGSVFIDGCAFFENYGYLEQAATVELSAINCPDNEKRGLLNHGTINFGTEGTVRSIQLTGDFKQTATGVLVIDLDWEGKKADTFEIDGDAIIDGSIRFNLMSIPAFNRQDYDDGKVYRIPDFLTANSLKIKDADALAMDTILLNYGVEVDGTSLDATMQLQGLERLNQNERNTFWGMNAARDELEGVKDVFLDMLGETELGRLRLDLDRVGNEVAANAILATGLSAVAHDPGRHNCRSDGTDGGLDGCISLSASAGMSDFGGEFEQRDFDIRHPGIDAGVVLNPASGPADSIVLALSVARPKIAIEGVASASGQETKVGLGLRKSFGGLLAEISMNAGRTEYDINRTVPDGENLESVTGRVRHSSRGIAGQLTLPISVGGMTVSPHVRASGARVKSNEYSEDTGSDLALNVEASRNSLVQYEAGARIDAPLFNSSGLDILPYAEFSLIRNRGADARVHSSFNAEASSFETITSLPRGVNRFTAGLRVKGRYSDLDGEVGFTMARGNGGRMKTRQMHLAAVYNF